MVSQFIRHDKREFQRLIGIQAGVAVGVVAVGEILVAYFFSAAGAFGDVLAGEFEVDAAGVRAFFMMNIKKAAHFIQNMIEFAGFVAAGRDHGVAVHRIAAPDDGAAFVFHGADEGGEFLFHLVMAHAGDQGQASGFVIRV